MNPQGRAVEYESAIFILSLARVETYLKFCRNYVWFQNEHLKIRVLVTNSVLLPCLKDTKHSNLCASLLEKGTTHSPGNSWWWRWCSRKGTQREQFEGGRRYGRGRPTFQQFWDPAVVTDSGAQFRAPLRTALTPTPRIREAQAAASVTLSLCLCQYEFSPRSSNSVLPQNMS